MQRPSHNPANYYLTQDGVINKTETYWDKLRDVSDELDIMSQYTFRRLVNTICGSLVGILPVCCLSPTKTISLFILVGVLAASLLLCTIQFIVLWEFHALKKRGAILYEALRIETEREYFEEEDVPTEERILLNHYTLSARFPINPFLYSILLLLLLGFNGGLLWIYFK